MRVKICGITRYEDAIAAAQLGVDAIGLVFYAKSKRAVTIPLAQSLIKNLPPFLSVVALFVNPSVKEVEEVLHNCPIDILQFHGEESAEFCEQFATPYIKAIRVSSDTNLVDAAAAYAVSRHCKALLLDAFVSGEQGGTGQCFDWSKIPSDWDVPYILSGGLNSNNLTQALSQLKPIAVDVSSGVEVFPGVKDFALMSAFIAGAKHGNV